MFDLDVESPKLPFGKYRGKRLSDPKVPGLYLRNLYASDSEHNAGWLWPDFRNALRAEVIRRGLPFGKHRGIPLDDLPWSYLNWAASIDLLPPLDDLVREEIDRRGRNERQRRRAKKK
jgi:uncharacterized protein (DUF3820 family)